MKKSEIKFNIDLDDNNVPEKIMWFATDNPSGQEEEARAIAIALWDESQKSTMKIDLWSKEMSVEEMKQFYIETIGGMAESLEHATNDKFMADEIRTLCKTLVKHVKEQK